MDLADKLINYYFKKYFSFVLFLY